MKKRQALLYVSIIAFLLSACQDSPKKSVVTSRNDGSFDTNVVQSAEESHAPDATESLTVFCDDCRNLRFLYGTTFNDVPNIHATS